MVTRRRLGSAAGVALALVALGVLCWSRADELQRALALVSVASLVALTALHLVTLIVRSEAWRLTLAAVEGSVPPRRAVHGANAGAFLAGSIESHSALPARVVLLKQLAGPRAPKATQILVSDAPIFLLEVCATALILCGATPWGLALLAGAIVLLFTGGHASQRFERLAALRGLKVLRDKRRLAALTGWVSVISAIGAGRVAIALAACGVSPTPERVGIAFTASGAYALSPVGPGAPVAATVTAVGTGGAPIAAGLVLAATSIGAVIVYALLVAVTLLALRQPLSRRVDLRAPSA
ncbi:hypothetical protein DVA67_001990 [Solirubrobacter sp. CPCC 204708]|uniref:Flippase-like domain-containing protein n=1 Tax=Solirubrobacter deserti TaxID=2282478 RepID=A0ABT4RR98_9ACTN|nr:hypothetical protein [Solirubrobacter deserti]MBE2314729.1 hypothetical protein [Solirubrobacter deserti]MDA0141046.1 flippase-like domain-containing protein [Solirubrobacter deserti]